MVKIMAHEQLTPEERDIVQGCLNAIASEIFIDAEEFEIITGIDFETLVAIQQAYPAVEDSEESIALALNGAMGNMLFYPHRQWKRWGEFIPTTPEAVLELHRKWTKLMGWPVSPADGGMYFFDSIR